MLRLRGGQVYDPANGCDGQVRDICIGDDGRIVSELPADAPVLDLSGCIVFPGGVDVHTHIGGAALNFARGMIPEQHRRAVPIYRTAHRRAGLVGTTPTTFATGYVYAGMGWTTANEAAVPVLSARHTHEELADTPILDKTTCVLMANNEILLDLLEQGEEEQARHVLAWYVHAAKAYGVKAVNPGGVAGWKWGKDCKGLHEVVPGYRRVTPAQIIATLARFCDELHLPHPLHLHCNNLGAPGNVHTTLETMRVADGHRVHFAHLQYHAYGGEDWFSMRSAAAEIADYFNRHPHFTADAGAVLFGTTVTVTADGPWQHLLYQLTGRKWGNLDVENETGCGVVPYTYKEKSIPNAVQWAVGLELLLLIDDPWRIALTTDHPNGATFWRYPEIIHLLMNADYRQEQLRKLPEKARSRIILPELTREYTLREIAIITSAGPARMLGLTQKGHLGPGADADIVVYNRSASIPQMFAHPRYVFKHGVLVIEEGELRASPEGHQYAVTPPFDPAIEDYLRPLFQQYYTISFENYPINPEQLPHVQLLSPPAPPHSVEQPQPASPPRPHSSSAASNPSSC
jgi:formylmethanofuran dehydrogenase subunit A